MLSTTIELPIYWVKEFKTKPNKTHLVSMNWYRNAHHYDQNKMKKDFHELVHNQLNGVVLPSAFKLELGIYYKNPNCDGANIAALIEKFSLDAFQEEKVVINDNVQYHLGSSWKILGQDKENPRCIVTLFETQKLNFNNGDTISA